MLAKKRSKVACLAALLLGASLLRAEIKVLRNFTLIDGSGRQPLAAAAMILDAGRIVWVGPAAQLKAPSGAETVDLTGKYVIPGIINLHAHLGNTIDLKQDAKFFTRENLEKNLATYASYGVTAVLSMGTDQDLIFQIRDRQRTGRPSMTRVFTAGQGFIFKGGYGGIAGVNQGVSSVGEVEPAVAVQAGKKVDFIKFWMDDELGRLPKMPYPIAKAIIDDAHRRHLRVTAHIFYLQDAKQLTDYGVDALAHSVRDKPVDQALIESMKKHGIWQMAATLSREASMFVYASAPRVPQRSFFHARRVADGHRDASQSAVPERGFIRPPVQGIPGLSRDRQEEHQDPRRCRRESTVSAPIRDLPDASRAISSTGKWNSWWKPA